MRQFNARRLQAGKAESNAPMIVTLLIIAAIAMVTYVEGYPKYLENQTKTEIVDIMNIDPFKKAERLKAEPDLLEERIKNAIQEQFGDRISTTSKGKNKIKVEVEPIRDQNFKFTSKILYVYEKVYPFLEPTEVEVRLSVKSGDV